MDSGTDKKAARYLRQLTERFPAFIGDVADRYEMRMRLDDVLAHRNMGPDVVTVQSMSINEENREFIASIVPNDGCSFLRISHVGVQVPGTRDGYRFSVAEIAKVTQMDPAAITDVLPTENGIAHVELRVPVIMASKIAPDEMRAALHRLCKPASESPPITDTEQALQAAQAQLEGEIRRLQNKGRSLIEIETATMSMRETIQRLTAEVEDERQSALTASTPLHGMPRDKQLIVNGNAAMMKMPHTVKAASEIRKHFTEWLIQQDLNGTSELRTSDIWGVESKPWLAHVKVIDDINSREGAETQMMPIGYLVESLLIEHGWIGRHENDETIYSKPRCKEIMIQDPQETSSDPKQPN